MDLGEDFSQARLGIRVVTLDRGLRHDVAETSPWLLAGAKTLSYAINRAAQREAVRRGADDVLFVSSDGFALEGPTSNVVTLTDGVVRTPNTDQGILAGTTQAAVFDFFQSRGLRTEFAPLTLARSGRRRDLARLQRPSGRAGDRTSTTASTRWMLRSPPTSTPTCSPAPSERWTTHVTPIRGRRRHRLG